jgi:UDP-N-acetylglucosamine 2-epimerase
MTEVLVHTGQHYDYGMSEVFFEELGLPTPGYHLGVGSAPHGAQTGRIMELLEAAIVGLEPDLVLVYGDTNSTLAGALVAAKLGIPLAHVEAGLRSYNRAMPEEINRVVTDHVSDLLLCPSAHSAGTLAKEGIIDGVHVTGDVNLDAMLSVAPDPLRAAELREPFRVEPGGYAIATVHRADNTDDPFRLQQILAGLGDVSAHVGPVILPLHPRTAARLEPHVFPESVRMVAPVGHEQMLALIAGARLGLTDSGGLQKELYWAGVPCITMREETEWVETVTAGWNIVTGADHDDIVAGAMSLLEGELGPRPPIYGDGHAAGTIVEVLARWRAETTVVA